MENIIKIKIWADTSKGAMEGIAAKIRMAISAARIPLIDFLELSGTQLNISEDKHDQEPIIEIDAGSNMELLFILRRCIEKLGIGRMLPIYRLP